VAYETILVERRGGVVVITLNRPEKLNALSMHLMGELDQAISQAEADEEVAAIVVTGAGERAFSSGADIHEMVGRSPEEMRQMQTARWEYYWHMATCTKPTIGAINGLAYGGGATLATTVDMRVGCSRTRFRFLAAQYGRLNSTWTLPLIVGLPMAMELLTTARVVEAEEALRMGLLNRLVPPERVVEEAVEIGQTIAQNNQRIVRGIKRLLQESVGLSWRQMFEREDQALKGPLEPTASAEESFRDFLKKRTSS